MVLAARRRVPLGARRGPGREMQGDTKSALTLSGGNQTDLRRFEESKEQGTTKNTRPRALALFRDKLIIPPMPI